MSTALETAAMAWVHSITLSVALDEGRLAPILRPKVEAWVEESTVGLFAALGFTGTDEEIRQLSLDAVAAFQARHPSPDEQAASLAATPST